MREKVFESRFRLEGFGFGESTGGAKGILVSNLLPGGNGLE